MVCLSPIYDPAKVDNNPVVTQAITVTLGLSPAVNALADAPIEID
jgi:hypothetical protein